MQNETWRGMRCVARAQNGTPFSPTYDRRYFHDEGWFLALELPRGYVKPKYKHFLEENSENEAQGFLLPRSRVRLQERTG